jgi:hypothetical protein
VENNSYYLALIEPTSSHTLQGTDDQEIKQDKVDFGGNTDCFMFLGFFEKNLKPKKCVLGVKNEKNEKSKYVFRMKMKSLRKESVLIFEEK